MYNTKLVSLHLSPIVLPVSTRGPTAPNTSFAQPPAFIAEILALINSSDFESLTVDLTAPDDPPELPIQELDWKRIDEALARLEPATVHFNLNMSPPSQKVVADIEALLPESRKKGVRVQCRFRVST